MSILRKIDPLLLEVFVAIADSGSFSAAADRVGRTKSAVSMQMKRLEALFEGNPIFEIQGRSKRLTTHGEQLLAHARLILRLNDSLWKTMAQKNGPGLIRLGAPDDYVYTLLPNILERYAKKFPRVEIEVTCEPSEGLSDLIGRNALDLAVVTRRPNDDVSRTIRLEPIVWATAKGRRFSKSEPLPLAMFQPGCVARAKTIEACARVGLAYRIAYSSPSIAGLLSPVRAGLAVAAIARCSVPADLEILAEGNDLPEVNGLDIALMRGGSSEHPHFVQHLADEIHASLSLL
ncbi:MULTISPECIES: LysR substrate-binding domain-containing protein [unclassified Neorhizobium]|uniref:LysR substrate-binding domain-containing protein n=1 Tax=unclassified Neorhizobium TaxID=2629175 RepID=UPI001FF28327|nr:MULTISPECIES: LysR substrate-binding domain-containing protein [unclassified Neorhizobium]MCJ9673281.1 LysR substrate-binding domain-containing protein [Neorhizobium sp. SHOUNA12B]MCJ9748677.1 LysR substrate-binding domain-containing protein [Neorhizobium sp. SHOUNA12A]